jgi:hypothetical protein
MLHMDSFFFDMDSRQASGTVFHDDACRRSAVITNCCHHIFFNSKANSSLLAAICHACVLSLWHI